MIEVKNLTKRYGSKVAVNDISFSVNSGEVLGFLGPNGAGKTTTMNIITGYLSSTEGTVIVGGSEILANPIKVKSQIGYLPEQPPLYLDMTVMEYLRFLFNLKKVKARRKEHIEEICERVRIADVRKRLIKNLSKGYRQRVGLAQALLGNPPVLILDEPTIGLDPKQIIEMRNLIQDLGQQHTVVLSSHILSEIQAICKRIIIIHEGSLVADGTPDHLSQTLSGTRRFIIRIDGPRLEVRDMLTSKPFIKKVDVLESREGDAFDFAVEPEEQQDIRNELFFSLAEMGWPMLALRSSELTLEEIFLMLTAGHGALPFIEDADTQPETEDVNPEGNGAPDGTDRPDDVDATEGGDD
jgi:ABC-2 type transport system ATP-binding protein